MSFNPLRYKGQWESLCLSSGKKILRSHFPKKGYHEENLFLQLPRARVDLKDHNKRSFLEQGSLTPSRSLVPGCASGGQACERAKLQNCQSAELERWGPLFQTVRYREHFLESFIFIGFISPKIAVRYLLLIPPLISHLKSIQTDITILYDLKSINSGITS